MVAVGDETKRGGHGQDVTLHDQARAGAIGDHNTVNIVEQARRVVGKVVVGSPPQVAVAFQVRRGVLDRMVGARGVVLRQVVAGDGGVGKSQVAASVFRDSDVEVRVWVSGESATSIVGAYAEAAVALDLAIEGDPAESAAKRFMGFMGASDKGWLVVVDNLVDPADLGGWWPPAGGQVVVTTRHRGVLAGDLKEVEVGCYTQPEAEAYLEERLGSLGDKLPAGALDEAVELAGDVGLLPLALSQAAAVIVSESITCGQYRERFADRSTSLPRLFPLTSTGDGYVDESGTARAVATTWALAIEAANKVDPVGVALPMAHLVAVCDADGAPQGVFTSEAACAYLSHELGETVDAVQARRGLRALHQLSLITHVPKELDPRAVRMHNVTARAVLETIDPEARGAVVKIAADGVFEVWPKIEREPGWGEALRATTQELRVVSPDALWDADEGGHVVLFEAGQSLREAGLAVPAAAHFGELLNQATTRLGTDHPDTLACQSNLAAAHRDSGDLDRAIPLFEQTLTTQERVLGPDHADTLTSRDYLAGTYESAGDLDRAIPLYEQNLANTERALGPDHPHTLTSQNNLAYAYESVGDLDRAIPLFEQTLTDRERVLGPNHPNTVVSRRNLDGARG